MVDLHSHILPGLDDGPVSCEESIRLIRAQLASGVDTIALTPHFSFENDDPVPFRRKRADVFEALRSELVKREIEVSLLLGAEVLLSPRILNYRYIRSLCYADTGFLLVELPGDPFPGWVPDVLCEIVREGITPVVAHVERYDGLSGNPEILYELVTGGVLTQTNADTLVSGGYGIRRRIFRLMEHNLIHFVVTDAHSVYFRPPRLDAAMEEITDRYGREKADYFDRNSRMLLENRRPALFEARRMKKPPGRRFFRPARDL